ncbi:MAG: hypothetical protein JWM80_3989 [Cyanobacteria bacterium RYN_339]|nr:hypothetical protein [Cyanobacteria bacterium RYN_339]
MNTRLLLACLLTTATLSACNGASTTAAKPSTAPSAGTPSAAPAFPPIDNEGCEHLQKGPAVALSGGATADATAPEFKLDHKRYDVALTGGKGFIKYQSAEAKEYVFFTSPTATVAVTDASGKAVALTSSAPSSKACSDIQGRYTAKLGIGVYYLGLSTTASKVSVVVEDANDPGGTD